IGIGCFAILLMYYLVGGAWGRIVEDVLEAASMTVPWMSLLFLPILVWASRLYPWAMRGAGAIVPELHHKRAYLNLTAFAMRAILYFAVWTAQIASMARVARRARAGDAEAPARLERQAGPGLVLFGLTASFAAVDWI